jgi:hypothetical protein
MRSYLAHTAIDPRAAIDPAARARAIDPATIPSGPLATLIERIDRYRLKLTLLAFELLGAHIFCAIVRDDRGAGLPFSIGAKAGLDPEPAAIGAIEEAFHVRTWLRTARRYGRSAPIVQRGLDWCRPERIEALRFWLESEPASFPAPRADIDPIEWFWSDITPPPLAATAIRVARVVVPSFQPFRLHRFPPGEVPHPFL